MVRHRYMSQLLPVLGCQDLVILDAHMVHAITHVLILASKIQEANLACQCMSSFICKFLLQLGHLQRVLFACAFSQWFGLPECEILSMFLLLSVFGCAQHCQQYICILEAEREFIHFVFASQEFCQKYFMKIDCLGHTLHQTSHILREHFIMFWGPNSLYTMCFFFCNKLVRKN